MHPKYKATHLGFVWVTWVKASPGCSQGFLGSWVKESLGCSQGFLGTSGKETEGSVLQRKNRMSGINKSTLHGIVSIATAYVVLMQFSRWLSWSTALMAAHLLAPIYKAMHAAKVHAGANIQGHACSQGTKQPTLAL